MKVWLSAALPAWILLAGSSPAAGEWKNFTASDGLPCGGGRLVYEDSSGAIWLSTCSGLVRCDGGGFTSYLPGDGSPANGTAGGAEDRQGRVWFWGEGVFRYDGHDFRRYTTRDGLAADRVRTVVRDRTGNLWFVTEGAGVTRHDGTTWTTFSARNGLADDDITGMFEDVRGNLWFMSRRDGVTRYDGSDWTTFTVADGLGSNEVHLVFEDSRRALWFATSAGVTRFDDAGWASFGPATGVGVGRVDQILEDGSGRVWFLEWNSRATSYDGRQWSSYPGEELCGEFGFSSAAVDGTGDLFVAGWGCVSRFTGSAWQAEEGCLGQIRLRVDRRGGLWELCDREWTCLREGPRRQCYPPTGPAEMFEDRRGNVWVSAREGLWRFDRAEHAWHAGPGTWFFSLLEDHAGDLWVGTDEMAAKYDGRSWTSYRIGTEPFFTPVRVVFEDTARNIWFATTDGVHRPDGLRLTTENGLASNDVRAIAEDGSGALWFGTASGASRFDGSSWRTFTVADGLPDNEVGQILSDHEGRLWVLAGRAVARFDGTVWSSVDQLAVDRVGQVAWALRDRSARLWFGTDSGVISYDREGWGTHAPPPLGTPIFADARGRLWFGKEGPVSEYDGETWRVFDDDDRNLTGVPGECVAVGLEDSFGRLWFGKDYCPGNNAGAGLWETVLDRVPPQTGFRSPPPRLSSSRSQVVSFATLADHGAGSPTFSYSLNGSAWSPWSPESRWIGSGLPDGTYTIRLRSRDWLGNVDTLITATTFEIDATPPVPVLSSPAYGQAVRDSITVHGTASDLRFAGYTIEVRPSTADTWSPPVASTVANSATPVTAGALGGWQTRDVPDGTYQMRLAVRDTLGLTGVTLVEIIVDNEAPWARETSPVLVRSAVGGAAYSTDGALRVYFPPRAFQQDATVTIAALGDSRTPEVLPDGASRLLPGYEVGWGDVALQKPGTLELAYRGSEWDAPAFEAAIYRAGPDSSWHRVGGTFDRSARTASMSLAAPGHYALYSGGTQGAGGPPLTVLTLTPRVLSPRGGFASDRLAITFQLGRAGSVDVKVFNRAGRLVRRVASDVPMQGGANLLHWDGRDDQGDLVPDGLYLVAAEAEGHRAVAAVYVAK